MLSAEEIAIDVEAKHSNFSPIPLIQPAIRVPDQQDQRICTPEEAILYKRREFGSLIATRLFTSITISLCLLLFFFSSIRLLTSPPQLSNSKAFCPFEFALLHSFLSFLPFILFQRRRNNCRLPSFPPSSFVDILTHERQEAANSPNNEFDRDDVVELWR